MDISKFTEQAQRVIAACQDIANRKYHQKICVFHLLAAILEDRDNSAFAILQKLGVEFSSLKLDLENQLSKEPKVEGRNAQPYLSKALLAVLSNAIDLAKKDGDQFVTAEYLLFSLSKDTEISSLLARYKVNSKKIKDSISELRKGRTASSQTAESSYEAIKKYTQNVTDIARDGKLDPVIGRDSEIRRIMQVLSRRTKNNPILIGEPGVGKTALVEGLALRIVNNDVPDSLKNTDLLILDLAAMLAGAKYRGDFEERMKSVLSEISSSEKDIVLFIDEIHTLVGAGKTDGAMDASNMLKPALAKGELHLVGATTLDEYKKYIEKDAALARRFQPVFIGEPSITDAIAILRGLKEKYELHHGVSITDAAIRGAVELSSRYINDRFLPDKAIDLIDEVASSIRMVVDSKPEPLDQLDRQIMRLQMEKTALLKEKNDSVRLEEVKKELKLLEKKSSDLTEAWMSEKRKMQSARDLKEALDQAKVDLERAQREGNLQKASELMYGLIPELTRKVEEASVLQSEKLLQEKVDIEEINKMISKWTGIPVTKLCTSERERILHIEQALEHRVIAQGEAVRAVSDAVKRSKVGLQDQKKPIGAFLFLGPTGVGKTELCKSVAEFLFDDEKALLRMDMSEYMEKHSVARLIGAPPGYVGYEEGGKLTDAVRRRPYQVILFDEIEKAHPDVFNILLQVLDDGRLTDAQGHIVNFANTIIILTSNIGGKILSDQHIKDKKSLVMKALSDTFQPEFLNRLDEIVIFNQLTPQDIGKIVDIQLKSLCQMLKSTKGIKLVLDDKAKKWLAEKGYDPVYGARPLKRLIQKEISNNIADLLLSGETRSTITVSCKGDKLEFS